MADTTEANDRAPAIDNRILAAVERNGRYLGLMEWLQRYQPEHQQPGRVVQDTAH